MTTIATHPLRILLVDDDVDDCDLFRDALGDTGTDTTLEVSYEGTRIMEILTKPEDLLPHLIFLDMNMPLVSGTECLREIRRASYLNSIPVIIFSTSCTAVDVESTYADGANLYIQKPSGFQPLVETLKKVLKLDWRKYIKERNRNHYVIAERVTA